MSKFVQIKTQLREPTYLKKALDDLRISYTEDAVYAHRYSAGNYRVPFLISEGRLQFGFRQDKSGAYEAVGDDMQMQRIRPVVDRIAQRYAYNLVVAETSRAGFDLVEENVGNDDVIRLTVRRWS